VTPFEQKLLKSMAESERKAWDALARYKFWMFGYHAGAWVRDNRFGGFKLPNPWLSLVRAARDHLKALVSKRAA
jgi:hypothetical protein